MARAALNWGVRELAQASGVGVNTVVRFENEKVEPNRSTLAAMQRALEAAGIEFLAGGGVRMREPAEAES